MEQPPPGSIPNSIFPFPIERQAFYDFHDLDWACGVYAIDNVVTDCRYVGRAMSIGHRLRDHCLSLRKTVQNKTYNVRMIADRDRLGEGLAPFRFAVLEYCGPDEYAAAELRWIHRIKANYNDGYYPAPNE